MQIQRAEPQIKTISDSVYYTLRKNILDLNLKPGKSISIKDISEELGVSRSPVRDAIIKLSKDGLVDSIPQSGTIISKIDLKRVAEERFLREALEEKTLPLFLEIYQEKDITFLKERIKGQRACMENGSYSEFLEHDDLFHEIFFQVSEKTMCWKTVQSMSGHYRRVRFMSLWNDSIMQQIIAEHEQLLNFILTKNEVETAKLIRIHCSQQKKEEKHLLRKFPEYFWKLEEQDITESESFLKKDFLNINTGR
jgi:Transcriptional regulators